MSAFSYASAVKAMAERDTRPCDGCGERARCAPNKRFGGLLCAPCSLRIKVAESVLAEKIPAPIKRVWSSEPCAVSALRALERTYREFRREPTPDARDSLIEAIHARCAPVQSRKGTR